MSKTINSLADMSRTYMRNSLLEMPDKELCEMMRAHFESHPCMPGEKVLKDQVNQLLALAEDGLADGQLLTNGEKKELASKYADTRIRITPLKDAIDLNHGAADQFAAVCFDTIGQEHSAIYVYEVDLALKREPSGEVSVYAETNILSVYPNAKITDNGESYVRIGSLPDNFLRNCPMNVDTCPAELQLVDYSNGYMNNLSARVVVDVDYMSGDVMELNDDMLSGLDQDDGLEQ